jgi:hypothetical protein
MDFHVHETEVLFIRTKWPESGNCEDIDVVTMLDGDRQHVQNLQ